MINSKDEKQAAPVFDVFNVFFDRIYEPSMHIVFCSDGIIDDIILKKAVTQYLKSDPYLSSRFEIKDGMYFWHHESGYKTEDYFYLKKIAGSAEYILNNPPPPVNVYKGPQIRAGIYRNESSDFLVFSCHHGFCDAGGLKFMAKEIFSIYRELKKNPLYIPEYKGWYYRGTKDILDKFSPEYIKSVLADETPFSDRWAFPFEYIGRGTPQFSMRKLSPVRMKKIKEFGKKYNATVNDILIGAFFLALLKINSCDSDEESEKSILTSADIRKYYGRDFDNHPQNLSVAFQISLKAKRDYELKDIIEETAKITRRKKSKDLGLGCIAFYEKIFSEGEFFINGFFDNMMQSYEKTNFKNPVFSNIGIIDENYFSNLKAKNNTDLNVTDAFFLPVVCHPPGFLMTASTFKDSIFIVCGYEEGPYSKDTVERFLEYTDFLILGND